MIILKEKVVPPSRNLSKEIIRSYSSSADDARAVNHAKLLADFIEKCVNADPEKRLEPDEALRHALWRES